MQLHRDTKNTLQELVVQFLCDARSFGKPLLKTNVEQSGQLVHADAVYQQCHQCSGNQANQPKPPGLPQGWLNAETYCSFRAVPQSVAVTRHHAKTVATGP